MLAQGEPGKPRRHRFYNECVLLVLESASDRQRYKDALADMRMRDVIAVSRDDALTAAQTHDCRVVVVAEDGALNKGLRLIEQIRYRCPGRVMSFVFLCDLDADAVRASGFVFDRVVSRRSDPRILYRRIAECMQIQARRSGAILSEDALPKAVAASDLTAEAMNIDGARLIYVSTATLAPDFAARNGQLRAISQSALQYNRANGITGILIQTNDYFIQVLEGQQRLIDDVYSRIRKDPRHTRIETVDTAPVGPRRFGSWSMLCLTAFGLASNPLFSEQFNPYEVTAEVLISLLHAASFSRPMDEAIGTAIHSNSGIARF